VLNFSFLEVFEETKIGIRKDIDPRKIVLVLKEVYTFILKYYNIDFVIKIPIDTDKLIINFSEAMLVSKVEYENIFLKGDLTKEHMLRVKQKDIIIDFEEKKAMDYKLFFGAEEIDMKKITLQPEKSLKQKESKTENGNEKIEINMNIEVPSNNKYSDNVKLSEESIKSSKLKLSQKELDELSKMKIASIFDYK